MNEIYLIQPNVFFLFKKKKKSYFLFYQFQFHFLNCTVVVVTNSRCRFFWWSTDLRFILMNKLSLHDVEPPQVRYIILLILTQKNITTLFQQGFVRNINHLCINHITYNSYLFGVYISKDQRSTLDTYAIDYIHRFDSCGCDVLRVRVQECNSLLELAV